MGFVGIFCLIVIPYTLTYYYLIKDINFDELTIYYNISFFIGVICSVMSCYISYTKGSLL